MLLHIRWRVGFQHWSIRRGGGDGDESDDVHAVHADVDAVHADGGDEEVGCFCPARESAADQLVPRCFGLLGSWRYTRAYLLSHIKCTNVHTCTFVYFNMPAYTHGATQAHSFTSLRIMLYTCSRVWLSLKAATWLEVAFDWNREKVDQWVLAASARWGDGGQKGGVGGTMG